MEGGGTMKLDKNPVGPKRMVVRTTFLELIGALIEARKNDAETIASVKRIFDRSEVRVVRSLAPIRLIAAQSRAGANRRGKVAKSGPAWA
jgi:hypothetical protein